jgi:hypothetical protein
MLISYSRNSHMSWLTEDLQKVFNELAAIKNDVEKARLYEQVDKVLRKNNKVFNNENANSGTIQTN